MATKTYKNDTKIDQLYYNSVREPILLRPGQSYTEDTSSRIDVAALVGKEIERDRVNQDVDEARRIKVVMAAISATKSLEELDKYEKGEMSPVVIDAITEKKKALLLAMENPGKKKEK